MIELAQNSRGNRSVSTALRVLLIGSLSLLLFLPVHPVMPQIGLDPSWILAINEAVAQGLTFGRDIIYTVGPLASIWTQAYHPATIQLVLLGGLLLAFAHATTTWLLVKDRKAGWLLAYAVFLLFFLESRDSLFLALPMLLSLLLYRMGRPEQCGDRIQLSRMETAALLTSLSALGLLPIIKLSFLPLALVVCGQGTLLFLKSKHGVNALMSVLSPVITAAVFWAMAGQDLSALPGYFINTAPIVSGYTQAMSLGFSPVMPAVYGLGALLVLLALYTEQRVTGLYPYVFFAVAGFFLFLSFKAGFVRHDEHALTAGSSLLLGALLAGHARPLQPRRMAPVFLIALVSWGTLHHQYAATSFAYAKPLCHQLWAELKLRLNSRHVPASFPARYAAHLADIRRAMPVPKLKGTVDVYPHDHAALLASGNRWAPRPVFQSFAVYTPALAALNAAYLAGSNAPANLLFCINAIDDRLPALDDGMSWPLIFTKYEPTQMNDHFLVLGKRAVESSPRTTAIHLPGEARLGEWIDPGEYDGILYAEIEVTPSVPGKLMNVLFKQTALRIGIELSNGQTKSCRFIPGPAGKGFVLSPYISSTRDFAALMGGGEARAELPIIRRFRVDEHPFKIGLWKTSYSIRLYRWSKHDHGESGHEPSNH